MADRADIQDRLAALRTGYAEQLPGKLADVAAQWQALQEAWDASQSENLHHSVHTLAGSAATFGFSDIGLLARQAEQMLRACTHEQRQPNAQKRKQLNDHIQRLCSQRDSQTADTRQAPAQTAQTIERQQHSQTPEQRLIFIIDEDESVTETLPQQLGHFDYRVRVFHDVGDVDEAFAEERPSALIININQDNKSLAGVALARGLKARYGQELPIIFTAPHDDFECRLQAVRAEGDAYFVKPLDAVPMVDRLDQITQNRAREPYRILVVEDDPDLAAHYALVLQQAGMTVTTLTSPENIINTLAEVRPELILMDVYMPLCSGLELAQLIRQQDAWLSIPIVFLSSETDMEKQFDAMRMGGDDFLTKPINDSHLRSSVGIRAERSRILSMLMVQDSLTGLLKHTKIKEQLAAEISRTSRSNEPLVYAMLDIDHFKNINDQYGHPTGDRVIKSLARLLRQRLRQSDSIGRYGGEEFAVVLPSCNLQAAEQVLNDIRDSFAKLRFRHEDQEFSVTLSVGLASIEQFHNAEDINRAADEALYDAKGAGRNRVAICKAEIPSREISGQ